MKKIILFILLGFLVANAQPGQSRYQGRTGYQQSIIWNDLHKSLQDSIRNIIGDSANANIINFLEDSLTASNGIVYSGRDFRQKIVKNIATLQAYDADSLGTTVYLKEVATGSYGGGEMVYVDSSDLKTILGYAVADSVVVFHAPTADRVWFRKNFADYKYINATWAGAKGDGSTDDSTAFAKARRSSINFLRGEIKIYIPAGTYVYTGSLNAELITEGNHNSKSEIFGDGIGATILAPSDTGADGISVNSNTSYTYNPYIHDLSIQGVGSGSATGKGIDLSYTQLGVIDRVRITGFKEGVYLNLVNSPVIQSSEIQNNWCGIWGNTAANEYQIRGCYVIQNDSIGWYHGAGINPGWYGGAMGSQPIHLKLGNGAQANIYGGNWESYETTGMYLSANSVTNIYNLSMNGGDNGRVFTVENGVGQLNIYNIVFSNITPTEGQVYMLGTGSNIRNYSGTPVRIYRSTIGDYHWAQPWVSKPDNAAFTADSSGGGNIEWYRARKVSGNQDRLYWYANQGGSRGYEEVEFTRAWDWGLNTSDTVGTQRSRPERMAFTFGHKDTTTLAGDSTVMFAQVDTNATGELYFAGGFTDRTTGTASDHYGGTYVEVLNYSTTTGKLKFLVWHPNATAGGLAIKLFWFAIYQRSTY